MIDEREFNSEEVLRKLDLHQFVQQLLAGYSDAQLAHANGIDLAKVEKLKQEFARMKR